MGLIYNTYLTGDKIFGCKNCRAHLATSETMISKSGIGYFDALLQAKGCQILRNFRGQHGKAYLFGNVVNIVQGEPGERNMTTGRHIVRDIFCRQCRETVGWKYDKAYEQNEKYKEGKFILEAELLSAVY